MNINQSLTAGQTIKVAGQGNFFRYMSGGAVLDVVFYLNGKEVSEATGITQGFAEKFNSGNFDALTITNKSATEQSVFCATRDGNEVFFDTPPTGNVAITNINGSFGQWQSAVTDSSLAIISANANRRYLMVQNKHETGNIYLNFSGNTASIVSGVLVGPGDSIEMSSYCPTGQITAIGDIPSNTKVVTVLG
jgi:hypothetical protein